MPPQTPPIDSRVLRATFDGAEPLTIGIEEELMLLDPHTLDLAPVAPQVLARLGGDGRAVIDRIIEGLPAHLAAGGCALLVQSSVTGTRETLDRLSDAGLEPAIVLRRRGPLGPILSGRVDYLIGKGLVRGPRLEEEVLVIAAQSPRARAGVSSVRAGEPGGVPLLHGVRRAAGPARTGA